MAAIEAVEDKTALHESLIVLPEAFNVKNGYSAPTRVRDATVKASLASISKEFQLALVAGLIDDSVDQTPGKSAAYLIDGATESLLTYKAGDDGSANYTPFARASTVVFHRGVCITSLICMDAAEFTENDIRLKELCAALDAVDASRVLICIPAHMQTYGSREVVRSWPERFSIVLANSAGYRKPSVVRRAFASELICTDSDGNELLTVDLEIGPPDETHRSQT